MTNNIDISLTQRTDNSAISDLKRKTLSEPTRTQV